VNGVNALCEIENAFGKSSLARVNVGRDTDISVFFDVFHVFSTMELMFVVMLRPKLEKKIALSRGRY
jgi:hypothetical protein